MFVFFFLIKYSFAKYSDLEIKKFLFDVNKIRKKIAQSFRQKQMHQENCMPCLLEVCYALTQFQSRDNKKKRMERAIHILGFVYLFFFFMREGLVRKKLEKIFFRWGIESFPWKKIYFKGIFYPKEQLRIIINIINAFWFWGHF